MPFSGELDVWDTPTPETEPFVDAAPEPIVVPGSQRVIACTECKGATQVLCKTCGGKGTTERTRRVRESDGTVRNETFQENCPHCRGYGKQPCPLCEGSGQLLEEKMFTWSRHGMVHSNADDLSGLHKLTIQTQAQPVFEGRIDPYEARWHQIAPLQELIETAIRAAGADSRLITAELAIQGVPVTEVDYQYKNKPHTLTLIGFNNEVRGDSTLFDMERLALYIAIAVLALVLAVGGGLYMLR
jgi:hypothetical protein